jgi:ABC-type nitrate/sulfonate/bicarbonate transport system permease component
LVLADRETQRDFRPALLIGARAALVILALAALTWAGSSAAAAFLFPDPEAVFPSTSPEPNYATYLLMQQISATAQAVGLAMLAVLGGSVLAHDLGRRLGVAR